MRIQISVDAERRHRKEGPERGVKEEDGFSNSVPPGGNIIHVRGQNGRLPDDI